MTPPMLEPDADALLEAKRRLRETYGEPLNVIYVTIFAEEGTFLLSDDGEGFIHPATWSRILEGLVGGYEGQPRPIDRVEGAEIIEDEAAAAKAIAAAFGRAQDRTGRIDPGYEEKPPGDQPGGGRGRSGA